MAKNKYKKWTDERKLELCGFILSGYSVKKISKLTGRSEDSIKNASRDLLGMPIDSSKSSEYSVLIPNCAYDSAFVSKKGRTMYTKEEKLYIIQSLMKYIPVEDYHTLKPYWENIAKRIGKPTNSVKEIAYRINRIRGFWSRVSIMFGKFIILTTEPIKN